MTAPNDASEPPTPGNRSKVAALIDDYGLDDLGDELELRWLREGEARQSLRDLADFFNRRVLRAAIESEDGNPIAGEVENLHRLLTDDDVTASSSAQAAAKLARIGVDAESIRRDFVSHQAIYTYLTKYRGVDAPDSRESPDESVQRRTDTISKLQNRLVAVTERSLDSLHSAGHLRLESFDVVVSVRVYCNECGTSYDVVDLLDQGGCDCRSSPP